jgi:hypothetical protein
VGYRIKLPEHKIEPFIAAQRRAADAAMKKPGQAAKSKAARVQNRARPVGVKPAAHPVSRPNVKAAAARNSQQSAKSPVSAGRTPIKVAS